MPQDLVPAGGQDEIHAQSRLLYDPVKRGHLKITSKRFDKRLADQQVAGHRTVSGTIINQYHGEML